MTALLPHDLEAEEQVLGAMLTHPTAVRAALAAGLAADSFYRPSYGLIFNAALALHERGERPDSVLVRAEIERMGRMAEVPGGLGEIASLPQRCAVAVNAAHHAERVADLAHRRQIIQAANETVRAALNGGVGEEQRRGLVAALQPRTVGSARSRFSGMSHAEALERQAPPTRQLVDGLVEAGTLGTIAGLPETGKSFLALQIALAVASGGGRILDRFDVSEAGPVAYWWQDDSEANELRRLQAYSLRHGLAGELPVRWHLNEGLELPRNLAAVRAEIEREKQMLVILDSLYNFLPAGMKFKDEEVAGIFARVKAEVCDPTGCALLFIDHAPWPTDANKEQRRGYGSVFKAAAIRWGIYLDRQGSTLKVSARGNNLPGLAPTPAAWDAEALRFSLVNPEEKAPASEIAAWIREQDGARAKPGEIRTQFAISDDTLRRRRPGLGELGIEYINEGYVSTKREPS